MLARRLHPDREYSSEYVRLIGVLLCCGGLLILGLLLGGAIPGGLPRRS